MQRHEDCFSPPVAKNLDDRFEHTEYVVAATGFEKLKLWEDFGQSGRLLWESQSNGLTAVLGYIGGLPINVGFSWAHLNKKLVLFYETVSRADDKDLVDQWLLNQCCPMTVEGRRAHTDGMNFGHCIQEFENWATLLRTPR
jgi:hypothetical protein